MCCHSMPLSKVPKQILPSRPTAVRGKKKTRGSSWPSCSSEKRGKFLRVTKGLVNLGGIKNHNSGQEQRVTKAEKGRRSGNLGLAKGGADRKERGRKEGATLRSGGVQLRTKIPSKKTGKISVETNICKINLPKSTEKAN